jgi:hypothetical protein
MKIIALAAASMMALAPMVVATSADARPHMKRHHSRMMSRHHGRMMHRMPARGMTPMQRHMRNAPASPIGGPVGSGRP